MGANDLDYDFGQFWDPSDSEKMYREGRVRGTRLEPSTRRNLYALAPSFYQAFPRAEGIGAGKLSLPYRAALELEPEFGEYEPQTTGDCTSHNTRNAGMIDYCVDALFGETTYAGRFATEAIYGMRGFRGAGMSVSRAVSYVSPEGSGGFLVRKAYESPNGQSVDLSRYNSRIGTGWGGSGTPSWLNQIAAQNKALAVYPCRSLAEVRDAISAGFGVGTGYGLGYSSRRDELGFARRQGGWNHARAWIGFDDTDQAHQHAGGGSPLEQNSWGRWNSGPKRLDQPEGSYWLFTRDAETALRGGEVFAFASVRGFNRELVYDTFSQIRSISDAS